jgi:hypothetical protein
VRSVPARFLLCSFVALVGCSVPNGGTSVEIAITSAEPDAPGGIRAAIEAANATVVPVRILSRLPPGTQSRLAHELPPLAGREIDLHARGLVLSEDAEGCVRPDGRKGCSGLVVTGEKIVVRELAATGFLFDGISVRGAKSVRILDGHFYRNLDDGIGVSDRATDIEIAGCLLEGNGFRSKGKGVLVFDHSHAVLRSNRIVRNRDGVTVSKRSHAVLDGNEILDSYDKGFGVTGASATAHEDRIVGSGAGRTPEGAGPNADGVRASLDASIELDAVVVTESGDAGVVAAGDSRIRVVDSTIARNGGGDVRATERAIVVVDDREVRGKDYGKPPPLKPPAPSRSDRAHRP